MAVEKDFYPGFSRFIGLNWDDKETCLFELKCGRSGRINRNEIRPIQKRSLRMSKGNGVYHKISDMSLGAKPADSFIIKRAPYAYLVIIFGTVAENRSYFIDIDAWLSATESSVSLTEDECASIASITAKI